MKKTAMILSVILLLAALLVGCTEGGSTPASTDATVQSNAPVDTNAPADTQATQEDSQTEGMYVEYNGVKIALGVNFADLKDALGEQTMPDQVIYPCDGGDAYKDTMHFYPALAVTENKDGIISNIEISDVYEGECQAKLMGTITIGNSQQEAVEALGEPDNFPLAEDDYSLNYNSEDQAIMVFLDPDSDKQTVSGVSMFLIQR